MSAMHAVLIIAPHAASVPTLGLRHMSHMSPVMNALSMQNVLAHAVAHGPEPQRQLFAALFSVMKPDMFCIWQQPMHIVIAIDEQLPPELPLLDPLLELPLDPLLLDPLLELLLLESSPLSPALPLLPLPPLLPPLLPPSACEMVPASP